MRREYLPDLQTFVKLSKKYHIIPVRKKIEVKCNPIHILHSFGDRSFAFEREGISIFGQASDVMVFTKYSRKNPFETISKFLRGKNALESAVPFDGGIIGYLGYDSVKPALGMEWKNPDPISLPHSIFLTVEKFYVSKRGELEAVYCAHVENEAKKAYFHAIEEVDAMVQLPMPRKTIREPRLTRVRANVTKKEFVKMVGDTKNRIFKGEIKQAIISRKISCKAGDPLAIYSKLRDLNPCPYMFYLRVGGGAILGSSPENFLTIRGTAAESCPVASTRRRGETAAEDRKLELELRESPKETSEHEMLFKACVREFKGACTNVRVVEKMRVKKFPFFMHLISKVCGRTQNPFKLLKVSFPSVTIAGVPKKKAMEIIDEVEPDARGVYCGSFGYASNSGNLDMGIVVRSILINKGRAFVPVGAGIVSQSVPDVEYMETFYKARPQLLALGAKQADLKWLEEL